MDVVIHLAVNVANPGDAALSFRTNVYGTYNVLRAAQSNLVGKVLLASSAPVHLPPGQSCSADGDFAYDLTKHLQEDMALHFARTYAMNIMALRLGHIVDGRARTDLNGVPLADVDYCRGGWVCQYDVARAFLRAAETDFDGYRMIDVIGSHQAEKRFDLEAAKGLIGFECGERFEGY
jgi:nucleoside-diphosphate-sugar epimerase